MKTQKCNTECKHINDFLIPSDMKVSVSLSSVKEGQVV